MVWIRLMEAPAKTSAEQVLVIDDDVELCKLVTRFLTREGFQIDSENAGAAGVGRALSGRYSLIVLDVIMPGMNGFDVLRRIPAESRPPFVILSAKGGGADP